MTAHQNLTAQAMACGAKVSRDEIRELLNLVGLGDSTVARRRLKDYSTGMKQRYGIAFALLGSPELLVLDEPLNGIDPSGMVEMRELLLSLNRESGITIFLSSHLLSELYRLATDYIFINYGKILKEISHPRLEVEMGQSQSLEEYFLNLLKEGL